MIIYGLKWRSTSNGCGDYIAQIEFRNGDNETDGSNEHEKIYVIVRAVSMAGSVPDSFEVFISDENIIDDLSRVCLAIKMESIARVRSLMARISVIRR